MSCGGFEGGQSNGLPAPRQTMTHRKRAIRRDPGYHGLNRVSPGLSEQAPAPDSGTPVAGPLYSYRR